MHTISLIKLLEFCDSSCKWVFLVLSVFSIEFTVPLEHGANELTNFFVTVLFISLKFIYQLSF
jgi:hypothetical protein